jgi:hypothetical protein
MSTDGRMRTEETTMTTATTTHASFGALRQIEAFAEAVVEADGH